MDENRHALIVATSKYRDVRLPPLRSPDQDAASLRDVLRNAEVGRFTVQVALNKRVQALRESLEEFFANRGRDDLLVVHFSCHGLKDDEGQLYLAAADTKVDLLRATALDTDWLRQLMNDCRSAKIAVFLDCCFGGAFATGMVHRVGIDQPGIKEHLAGAGRVVITASNAVQYAFEGGNLVGTPEASVFTKALVTGLESGEADRNDDGKVTINELFEYLADKVREASPGQTPTKWAFNEVGDWEIATSRRPSINLLPADLRQRMTSTDTVQRLSAVAELAGLLEAPDQRIADSAALAFGLLVTDDSERVKTAAKQLLRDRPTNPAPARPEPRDDEDESARLAEERAKAAAVRDRQELERQELERQELERQERERQELAAAASRAAAAAEDAKRRRRLMIGIGGVAGGIALLGAIAWAGCVGRNCGPSPTPNDSGGPVIGDSGGPVVGEPRGTIVFAVKAGDGYDLWVVSADGSGMKPLVQEAGTQNDPSWSPDHEQIVYRDTRVGLKIVTKGGDPVMNFTSEAKDTHPAWSPNGDTIAFASDRSTTYDVYKLPTSTPNANPIPVADSAAKEWDPSWSPNGDRIAFASGKDGPPGKDGPFAIYTMDVNGGDVKAVTTDEASYEDPAWSPNGDWIAVTRRDPGAQLTDPKQLWLTHPDGTGAHQLMTESVGASDPTWSADSQFLAYAGGSPQRIVIINIEGKELRTVGPDGTTSGWPDWR